MFYFIMITKSTPKRIRPVKPLVKRANGNIDVGPNDDLVAFLNSIAERGSNIPQELKDQIWHDLEAQGFCAGSGPVPD